MSKKVSLRVSAYICAFCVMCLTVLSAFMPSVKAAEISGKVNLSCVIDENPVDGLKWSLFYVAEKNSAGEYVLSGNFAGYPVSLENLTQDNIQNVANTLENYTNTDSISPNESAVTDKTGCASFNITKQGLYLLTGKSFVKGTKRYIPTASFVEIKNDTKMPVTVYPKFSIEDITPQSKNYSVTKKWNGDENYSDKRPVSVKAEIYKNGEIYKTVSLSEENNWTYSWTSAGNNQWTVKEINVSKYYNVEYKNSSYNFEIVNTIDKKAVTEGGTDGGNESSQPEDDSNNDSDNSDESTGGSDSSQSDSEVGSSEPDTSSASESGGESLPQTGQLWWPVPIMAIAGLIFIAMGIRMGGEKKDNSENEEK